MSRATEHHDTLRNGGGGGGKLQLHRAQPARDVPYVPSEDAVVDGMLELAHVGEGDVVYDLGCGDGRIVIAAAKRGARGVGVDIDLQRIKECYWNARKAGVGARVRFIRDSFFNVDLREATVVTLYLLTGLNVRLRPKLMAELRPGARVISNYFDMGDWKPDERREVGKRTLYRWNVPAWVSGTWRCVVNDHQHGRRHMTLSLERRFQSVIGTARIGRSERPIVDGQIDGNRVAFTVNDPVMRGLVRYECSVLGKIARGTCGSMEWGGIRAR